MRSEDDDSDDEDFIEDDYEDPRSRNRGRAPVSEDSSHSRKNRIQSEQSNVKERPKRNKAKMQIIEQDQEDEDMEEVQYEE